MKKEELTPDGAWLWKGIEVLSGIRESSREGWTRRAFTPEYIEARKVIRGWMEEAGLQVGLDAAANLVGELPVPGIVIILLIIFIMFLLGMIMVPVGIYALTLPIVFPIIVRLGYDPIWFGVICLKMTEIGAVTPPVGLNVYAMKGVAGKDISLEKIFAGVWPFVVCDLIVLVLMIVFPQITTWLPNILIG